MPRKIVLLGPPASGKGTQGRKLAASLDLGYLSTGALLREHVERDTALGRIASPILARGEYLPDELMDRILVEWLNAQNGGWVLDGYPRSLPQAEFLNAWLQDNAFSLDAAILLEVPYAELLLRIRGRRECPDCRWSGQQNQTNGTDRCPVCSSIVSPRADDTEENFQNRYEEFVRVTTPVLAHYQDINLLMRFDATVPQEQLAADLLRHMSA